jgi:hypothetical protein
LDNKTVFIIGAGASKEANLPTGYELKGRISSLLDMRFDFGRQQQGDALIYQALLTHVQDMPGGIKQDVGSYIEEAQHIVDALPLAISIDNLIDSQRGNEKFALCGKLAIVRSILEAERNSHLFFERVNIFRNIDFAALEKTWYVPFFQIITENCCRNDLEKRFNSIALIIFNYDRCLEHFLYYALQHYCHISDNEAAKIIGNISIYHPYGSVGLLPWFGQSDTMGFGAEPNSNQLLKLTSKIKTFTEGTDPKSSDIADIREHMRSAVKLAFIGFAFHKLNLQLISPIKYKKVYGPKCYATTYGISDGDKEVISDHIDNMYKIKIDKKLVSSTCNDFFYEFWRSLSF